MAARCSGLVPTTPTDDPHTELLDELAEHLGHRLGFERIDGVARAVFNGSPRSEYTTRAATNSRQGIESARACAPDPSSSSSRSRRS
jgi:hypothetical protein